MSDRHSDERDRMDHGAPHDSFFWSDSRIQRAALASRHKTGRPSKQRHRKAEDVDRDAMKREIAELRAALANVTAVLRRLYIDQTPSDPVLEHAGLSEPAVPDLVGLGSRYEMSVQGEVRVHLAKRPHLGVVLADAADELSRRFGQVKLALLAREDERLVVAIDTDLEVEEAEKKLAAFGREWWQLKINVEDRTAVKLRFV